MSKYDFHRLGAASFEQMAQALLEKERRGYGDLIQFGDGADGGREATWSQPPGHPTYARPRGATDDRRVQWIFQAKFHDIGARGWKDAGDAVVSDLRSELTKVLGKHQLNCDRYVLITNVPLSGTRHTGLRDRLSALVDEFHPRIESVEIWGAADLSRMLDNNADVRAAYIELILTGDVIFRLYTHLSDKNDRRDACFRGYLEYLLDSEAKARAEEAGDEDNVLLSRVFIDQSLQLDRPTLPQKYNGLLREWYSSPRRSPESADDSGVVPASLALLLAPADRSLLLAGPGCGKSTITQFLTLYCASRIIAPSIAHTLAGRLSLGTDLTPAGVDVGCELRFPFRIELRRFAKWRRQSLGQATTPTLAQYVVEELIGKNVSAQGLTEDDIFTLVATNPTLLILDGLDEVPDKDSRSAILKDCSAFVYRCIGEKADLRIIMSSRPQGYNGEFQTFDPVIWEIAPLSESQFDSYCDAWLAERIKTNDERVDAKERIRRGMQSASVKRLATTLLQATVMLTIVRRKSDIPDERHQLFKRYVEVAFQRERTKNALIAQYELELLRLHEVAGYRLHEAVGAGQNGSLSAGRFRELVRDVWLETRGAKAFSGTPNDECAQLAELATDRLVFLTGKGQDQSEIDFLIQPYREYFAAQYLSQHTSGDADLIFERLVERGAFWLNVLQFYVAAAAPAQQLRWLLSKPDFDDDSLTGLIQRVQRQRAALTILPETTRLKLSEVRMVVSAAFPKEYWWTWLRESWGPSILQTARAGEGATHLLKLALELGVIADGFEFVTWLFSAGASRLSLEQPSLLTFLAQCQRDPALKQASLEFAVKHDLPLEFSETDEALAATVLVDDQRARRSSATARILTQLTRFSDEAQLRILCRTGGHIATHSGASTPWQLLRLPVEAALASPLALSQLGVRVMAPQWLRLRPAAQAMLDFRTESPDDMGPCQTYLRAIYETLLHPDDSDAHERARRAAGAAFQPNELPWNFAPSTVLAPSPSLFRTVEDWKKYVQELSQLFDSQESQNALELLLTVDTSSQERPWLLFLFHHQDWESLAENGLIDHKRIERFRESDWGKVLSLPQAYVESVIATVQRPGGSIAIPALPLLRVVLGAHAKGRLFSATASGSLSLIFPSESDSSTVNKLISSALELAPLPKTWTTTFTPALAATPEVLLENVTAFWSRNPTSNPFWYGVYDIEQQQKVLTIARRLANYKELDSVTLGGLLAWQVIDRDNALSSAINTSVCRALAADLTTHNANRAWFALTQTRATLEEAELLAQSTHYQVLCQHAYRTAEHVAHRIASLPQNCSDAESPALRTALSAIVSESNNFPSVVRAAALQSLIELHVSSLAPMDERLWLASSVSS